MLKKISSDDERRLTNAIEKAATIASVSDNTDRNELLAKCLTERDIPSKFAKIASEAFNKRLTVLRFHKTADEHKAEPFALADPDTVLGLLGGIADAVQNKVASMLSDDFVIDVASDNEPEMRKVASMPVRDKYEDTVNNEIYERHLMSVMDKQAAAHTKLLGTLSDLEARIAKEHAEVVEGLRKTSSFEFQTLCNVHGDRMATALQDYVPEHTFKKTAAAVDPETKLSIKIAKLLDDIDQFRSLNNAIADYQDGLDEFCKSAAEHSKMMRKQADLGSALRSVFAVTNTGVNAANKVREATTDALTAGYGNAGKYMNAARNYDERLMAPAGVLDSEFLTRDRFRDRLLGWSDMTADQGLAMTNSPEDIFYVTQKVMDMNPNLERPDNRELLRSTVSQLLAQNGRASMADLGALSTILQNYGRARRGAVEESFRPVTELEKKVGPDAPELDKILPDSIRSDGTDDVLKDTIKAMADEEAGKTKAEADLDRAQTEQQRATTQHMKEIEAERKQRVLEQQRQAQQTLAEKRQDLAEKRQDMAEKQRARQLEATAKREFARAIGLTPHMDVTDPSNPRHDGYNIDGSSDTLTQAEVDAMLDAYWKSINH